MTAPYFQDEWLTVLEGDCREVMAGMEPESVHCVVTSPPYWGLRDYGTPGQLGLEQTPEAYVAALVDVFREVRRVLRADGTVWLNLGSSYFGSGKGGNPEGSPWSGFMGSAAREKAAMPGAVGASGRNPSRPPQRAPAYGIDGTEPRGSTGPGSAYSGLCDGCRAVQSTHTTDTLQPLPAVSPLRSLIARDTELAGSAPSLPGASPLAVPASTTTQSEPPPPAACVHCEVCSVCLSVLGSSTRDARACVRRSDDRIGRGQTEPPSDARIAGTGPSDLAWGHYASSLKPKDMVPIPWMVAMALQADGWYLRSDIIWAKPNPMPESVTDRPTKAHEMIFLLSKSPRYFFDSDAVREGVGEARVVQAANGHDQRLVLGQDGRLQSSAAHSNSVGVRLAAAVFDLAQRQDHLGLPSLDPQIWQEGGHDGAGARTVGDPIVRRAAAEATRFADGDASAKEFLREVDRLCVALPDGHDLKELRTRSGPSAASAVPLVDADGDAAVAVDDAREVGQFEFVHDAKYTAGLTHRSAHMAGTQRNDGDRWRTVDGGVAARGAGRNLRSVWTIATAPYPGAHFATFPPRLVEPCIKAGTSERGVCPECGAPWERVVERVGGWHTGNDTPKAAAFYEAQRPASRGATSGLAQAGWREVERSTTTTGWRPTCAHTVCADCRIDGGLSELRRLPIAEPCGECAGVLQPLDPIPATVLDIFAGTGTVGLVAAALSRRAVLIDLNAEYLRQCLERNRQTPLGLPA